MDVPDCIVVRPRTKIQPSTRLSVLQHHRRVASEFRLLPDVEGRRRQTALTGRELSQRAGCRSNRTANERLVKRNVALRLPSKGPLHAVLWPGFLLARVLSTSQSRQSTLPGRQTTGRSSGSVHYSQQRSVYLRINGQIILAGTQKNKGD